MLPLEFFLYKNGAIWCILSVKINYTDGQKMLDTKVSLTYLEGFKISDSS